MAGAADSIRAGVLERHKALDKAGLRPYEVVMGLKISEAGAKPHLGVTGYEVEQRLTLSPRPDVVMRRQEYLTPYGAPVASDAVLTGAFPKQLSGKEFHAGIEQNGITAFYAGPSEFLADLEKAEYFTLNGETYQFASTNTEGTGFISVDAQLSEWKLKLIRAPKQ